MIAFLHSAQSHGYWVVCSRILLSMKVSTFINLFSGHNQESMSSAVKKIIAPDYSTRMFIDEQMSLGHPPTLPSVQSINFYNNIPFLYFLPLSVMRYRHYWNFWIVISLLEYYKFKDQAGMDKWLLVRSTVATTYRILSKKKKSWTWSCSDFWVPSHPY